MVEKELGLGGMARVYLAKEIKLDRMVALKVLNLLTDQGQDLGERFMREARTAAKLSHSNIVAIHDVGQIRNRIYYMAMEYLSGGVLADLVKRDSLDPKYALEIFSAVASALDYAHSKGFIHRDVKPDNILFREDGTPVLCDFGIARAVGSATRLTKTGMSVGTPHYMSPEQARGKPLDGRSDLYSLGVVLYEMLTGKVPFEAEDSVAVAIAHVQDPVPRLPEHLEKYQPLLDKLLAKDPDQRPQTGKEAISLAQNPTGVQVAFQNGESIVFEIHSSGFAGGQGGGNLKSEGSENISITNQSNEDKNLKTSLEMQRGMKAFDAMLDQADRELKGIDLGSRIKTGVHRLRTHLASVDKIQGGDQSVDYKTNDYRDPWKKTLFILMVMFFLLLGVKLISDANVRREREFWRLTSTGDSVFAYTKYLKNYPNGLYASQARSRLGELRQRVEEIRRNHAELDRQRQETIRKQQDSQRRVKAAMEQRQLEAKTIDNRVNRYLATARQCIADGDDHGALSVVDAALKLRQSRELQNLKAAIESRIQNEAKKKSETENKSVAESAKPPREIGSESETKNKFVAESAKPRREIVNEGQVASSVDNLPVAVSTPYPEISRRALRGLKQNATMAISFLVNHFGKVERIKFIRRSGVPDIDMEIARTVSNWTYRPAIKQGKKVKTWLSESFTIKK